MVSVHVSNSSSAKATLQSSVHARAGFLGTICSIQNEVEFQDVEVFNTILAIGCWAGRILIPMRNQGCTNSEHGIGIQIFIAVAKYMGNQSFEARRLDHEVHVRRSPWMTTNGTQHSTDRPI